MFHSFREQFSHQWVSEKMNEESKNISEQIPVYDRIFNKDHKIVRKSSSPNIWKSLHFIFDNLDYDGGSFYSPWTPSSLENLTSNKTRMSPHYLVGRSDDQQLLTFNTSVFAINEIFNEILPMHSSYSFIFKGLAQSNMDEFLETLIGKCLHDFYKKQKQEYKNEPPVLKSLTKKETLEKSFPEFLNGYNLDAGLTFCAKTFKMPCDYIFYKGDSIRPFRVLDIPSLKVLQSIQSTDPIPNQFFPSDHFYLVADFKM
jgi:hypothetical protein